MLQLGACHLGIYLRRGDVRVTEYLAYCLNRHTVFQGQYCKRVPTNVVRDSFLDATHCSHFLDALVDSVKSADIEQVAVLSQWLVSLNNLHRNIHQLDLKRYACLLTLGNYPRSTVYHTDVVLRQVLCVNERDTCPTAKNEKVSCKCHVWVFQLYLGHGGKLVQGQELTLLVVWVNVVHGKRVSRYLAVVVCCRDDMLQRNGVYPNGGLRKPYNVLQVQAKVTDELLGKLIHGHIAALVLKFDELGNVHSYHKILAISPNSSVFAQRVGKDRAVRTYRKYLTVRKYVAEFIKFQYKRSDMSMNELTEEFIRDFCLYLKNVIGLTQSTIWIYSIPLKHIVTAAHYNGKIQRNPFAMYHVDPDHKEREFLTEEELDILAGIELENPNFAFARDLFMFGCWTGISFVDIKNLTEDNVAIISGSPWIVSRRQKTGVPFKIKLIDAAIQIIERYKPLRKDMHLFNIGSLDMVNKRIKKVAKMCGIKKRISFHVSRHSFAVLALNYGMPIESVSKILGHTDIATTQIYAKVTSTKLEHDISAFESRIKGHMPTMGGMA